MNWRLGILRILVNGLAIAITTALLPGIRVAEGGVLTYLFLGAVFGLLNAFVKPLVQFLTLNLIFVTFGLIIVIINTVMLLLLEWLLPDWLTIRSLLWAAAGGTLISFLGIVLESLLGMSPPIIDDAVAGAREETP